MSRAMREPPNISEERLRVCLEEQYAIDPIAIEFLPLGLDYNAGVYRVVSAQGTPYLLKVTSRPLYEPGLRVPRYLQDAGIAAVVASIPTRNNALWTKLEDWIVIVYPYIEGDSSLQGMTDELWKELGGIFRQIHGVRLPQEGFELLRKETFDPTEYFHWIHNFEKQYVYADNVGSATTRALCASWIANQSTIASVVATLEKLAQMLQSRNFPYVICHADLHPANLIRDHAGRVFVIDWDEVMLAPRERDFIFIREPEAAAFWLGYGEIEIDWMLLSYYLWERVVQDLIAYAQDACFRDDLGEASRMDNVKMFDVNLSEGGKNFVVAVRSSTHLADQPGLFSGPSEVNHDDIYG